MKLKCSIRRDDACCNYFYFCIVKIIDNCNDNTNMTKEELYKMMNEHPVMHVTTNDNGQPRVRAILMFKADADGIVFHTGVTKDLHRQLLNDPRSEVCFACGKYQVRVEGCFELVEDMALKEEIVNHPSRKFLKPWREQQGDEAFFNFLKVFRMQHGKAHVWCMEDNFKPKEYIEL